MPPGARSQKSSRNRPNPARQAIGRCPGAAPCARCRLPPVPTWRRRWLVDRVRELLAAARTAEAVARTPDDDGDDDPRAHLAQALAFRREAAQLRRALVAR